MVLMYAFYFIIAYIYENKKKTYGQTRVLLNHELKWIFKAYKYKYP